MSRFRFLHAADLHLDSPLQGLRRRAETHAARLEDASRRAFDSLVQLAIGEECRLLVIAGDVFDGQWRDYRTGLFFAERLRTLREAGVAVVMIAGNHDAENRDAARVLRGDGVRLLSSKAAETVTFADIGVAVHGRSFPQRDVRENIARDYPPPVPGLFNVGLLHTACGGRDGHEPYAPCTLEQLVNHGYQYWALGHVHAREVLATDPWVVFPGNLQGRSVRETGPKGATLVEVEDGRVVGCEHRPLDRIRWAVEDVDVAAAADRDDVRACVRDALERSAAAADGRGLAVRVRLRGVTALHAELIATDSRLGEEIEIDAAGVAADVWVERVEIATEPLSTPPPDGLDPSVGGTLRRHIDELASGPWVAERLRARLAEIRVKLPEGARRDALLVDLEREAAERGRSLAAALVARGGD